MTLPSFPLTREGVARWLCDELDDGPFDESTGYGRSFWLARADAVLALVRSVGERMYREGWDDGCCDESRGIAVEMPFALATVLAPEEPR